MNDDRSDLGPLLASRLVLEMPERLVFPPPWVGHIPFAFWLVEALRPCLVVELGTHSGNSYCAFLQALIAIEGGGRAFAVDTWAGDEHAGRYDGSVHDELAAYHDPRYGHVSTLLRMTFDAALPRFDDGSIDLLHIDGFHTYDAVRHDFDTWLPKMSPRGVILLHDTHVRDRGFGVWRFFDEVRMRYPAFAFEHSHGLGVIHVGSEPMPAGLRWLFDAMAADGAAARQVRRFFARLGEPLVERAPGAAPPSTQPVMPVVSGGADLRDTVSRLTVAREQARWRADSLAAEVAALDRQLRARDRELAAVFASTSWRATAGLRLAVTALRQALASWAGRQAADLGLDPGARFDAAYYLEQNPDVRQAGIDPWQHFVKRGAGEGRRPNPYFDPAWYLATYPDARASGRNPLVHYLLEGAAAGHDPSPEFSAAAYRAAYPDADSSGLEPLDYHLQFGVAAGRMAIHRDRSRHWPRFEPPREPYEAWLAVNRLSVRDVDDLRAALRERRGRVPRVSLVTPVHEADPAAFKAMIESVLAQVHDDWELCLVDDGSRAPHVRSMIEAAAARDPRIRIGRLERRGGISAATNAAIAMASGDVVAFLDQDDQITPDCVAELALYYADHPEADLVYSDDDRIDTTGRRHDPQFKPDWSPVLLLANMYLAHIVSVRRALLTAVGGLRPDYDGAQDHDLALRVSEAARHVGHIPKVLYHGRAAPGSAAAVGRAKSRTVAVARRAVADALARRGLGDVEVANAGWAESHAQAAFEMTFADDGPGVTIVIPTRNRVELLRACVESLAATRYRNYDVLVVDNDSDDDAALAYLAILEDRPRIRVVRLSSRGGVFNFAELNNEAARLYCTGDYVLFLNNDTAVVDPGWLSAMVGYAGMPGVGTVGARLLYGDGRVQHAGTVKGVGDWLAEHAFRGIAAEDLGYMGLARTTRECSAVTGACMLVARSLFEQLGGFDATRFAVAYNDIDFGYRVLRAGLRNIYCASATLHHFEGQSRGTGDAPEERAAFRALYERDRDPWYNPNLSLETLYRPAAVRPARRRPQPLSVVVATSRLAGDDATALQELVLALAARGGFKVAVLAGAGGALERSYAAAGIPVVLQPEVARVGASSAAVDADVAVAVDRLKTMRADVVLADGAETFVSVAAAERAGLPAVWRRHDTEAWQAWFGRSPRSAVDIAYRAHLSAYRLCFPSRQMRSAAAALAARGNDAVIRPARPLADVVGALAAWDRQDARRRLGLADDAVLAVVAGAIGAAMSQADVVAACARLPEAVQRRCHVAFLGAVAEPAYAASLLRAAGTLPDPMASRILIVDPAEGPWLSLAAADIAVCTGSTTAAGRDLAAAMVARLPLVVADWPEAHEVVEDHVNALFYPPGDAAALAHRLAHLADDAVWRRALGERSGAVLAARPSFDAMVAGYAAALDEAANLATEPPAGLG